MVPFNVGVARKVNVAGLNSRVSGNLLQGWWQNSFHAQCGPYLHSLVLARPGRFRNLDLEGRTCCAYFRETVYTVNVLQVWKVETENPRFITLCAQTCNNSEVFSLKKGAVLPWEDYSGVLMQSALGMQTAADVFAQCGSLTHVRMLPLVEPLAELMAKNC